MTVDAILDDVLAREGGFVDHPDDRGSSTNFGITAATLGDWRKLGRTATSDEVRTLTRAEALDIYRAYYVERPRFHLIGHSKLRALLVDFGVHSGPARAVKALQRAVGVPVDGVLGPVTMAALKDASAAHVYRMVLKERGELLATILQRDASQRAFAAGWMRRLMEFV